MIRVPREVWEALGDSSTVTYSAGVAQYGDRTATLNLTPSGGVQWSADGEIQASGSIHVSGFGDHLLPLSRDSMLAPFGQEVSLSRVVVLRDQEYPISLGVFRVAGNDGGRWRSTRELVRAGNRGEPGVLELDGSGLLFTSPELFVDDDGFLNVDAFPLDGDGLFVGEDLVPEAWSPEVILDWEVNVRLADRFRVLQRAQIVNPASPPQNASMYSELRRLGLFPLIEGVPDVPVPAGMVYDDRLSGVHALAAAGGGKPRLTRDGVLTVRQADRWLTETDPDFDLGGALSFDREQSDEFYNYVWAHSDDGKFSAFAVFDDDSDPRSVNRAGVSTYEHSSPQYVSNGGAQAGANTILSRLLNKRSARVKADVDLRGLLVELSDVGWVRDPATGRAVFGEVVGIEIPNDPTLPVSLELVVSEEA